MKQKILKCLETKWVCQLLLVDNSIVIIEVKPFREMINSKVLRKHKALRKYCKEKGFGVCEAKINEKQICYIIWKNNRHLKYQQSRITYK